MCDFVSCWVNDNGDIACADLYSHEQTQELMGWGIDECLRWREVEWTRPGVKNLRIRLCPDDDHDENWYKACILAKYPTVDALINECVAQTSNLTGVVYISRIEWITSLPETLNCQALFCTDCIGLTKLPTLPECHTLYCSGCFNLKALPEMPNCQILHCSNCNSLVELPELPKCRGLSCYNCPNLVSLPELPKCLDLCCSGCKQLTSLPELDAQCRVVQKFVMSVATTRQDRTGVEVIF